MNAEFTIENPKTYMGWEVIIHKEFLGDGEWGSIRKAESWLKQNGYDYGSSDAMKPTAITVGDYYQTPLPHKWHNFKKDHFKHVAGCITGCMRNGPVHVRIFKPRP